MPNAKNKESSEKVKFIGGVALTRYPLFTYVDTMPEKRLISKCRKSDKNNLRLISKPRTLLQTMTKTHVKFQKIRHKTAGGAAHTRYPLSIHFKVIYKGFLNSCIVLYASELSSSNHYAENRIRKFQLVHKLQRCFSSHYLFSCKDNLP